MAVKLMRALLKRNSKSGLSPSNQDQKTTPLSITRPPPTTIANAPSSSPRVTPLIAFPAKNPIKNSINSRLRSLSNNPVFTVIISKAATTKIKNGATVESRTGDTSRVISRSLFQLVCRRTMVSSAITDAKTYVTSKSKANITKFCKISVGTEWSASKAIIKIHVVIAPVMIR